MAATVILVMAGALAAALAAGWLLLVECYGVDFARARMRSLGLVLAATLAAVAVVLVLADGGTRNRVEALIMLTAITLECAGIMRTLGRRSEGERETLDLGPYPARPMLYLGAALMAATGLASLLSSVGQPISWHVLARTAFLASSASLLMIVARSHVRISAVGVHQFGHLVPWDRVESWEWQDYSTTVALQLNLREPYWFQNAVPIAISANQREAVHQWLMQRIPFRADPLLRG